VETGQRRPTVNWLPYLYSALLFAVNLLVAHRLFSTEFTQHTNSNEGAFMAISRFLAERWPDVRWFPLWLNGVPIENTYFPLLQVIVAAAIKAMHWSPALAYHAVVAFFYCLGPVCLFLFAWNLSKLVHAAFLSGLLYSLWSPSLVMPMVLADTGGWHNARRLQTLVHYGEGNHNTGLSLLPLALLFAWLAMRRRNFGWSLASGILLAAVLLTNAFASVDLAIGIMILVVLEPPGARLPSLVRMACIAAATYLWISPILTPNLLHTIRTNSMMVEGEYHYTPRVILTGLLVLAGAALLWYLTRRMKNTLERFAALFAYILATVVGLAYYANTAILPQPWRYQLEMEMGLCLLPVFGARRALTRAIPLARTAALAVLLLFLAWQAVGYWGYARSLIQPTDITKTIQYKIATWIDANLKGQRVMVSDDAGYWFNVFSDNPQLSAAPDPFSPNWLVEIGTYTIYSGQNAGERDAEYAILWLRAFGCQAVTVPGPNSRESNHPFHNPAKFAGVLPLLWHQEDDSIYAVPQRSRSLAHVIPAEAVVKRPPLQGLDVEEVAKFVAALEDPALPLADFSWRSNSQARIVTNLHRGQVVAVQVNHDPGWVATANGRPASVTRDGIGLVTLHPECDGPCEILLTFERGAQRRICLGLSVLVMFVVAVGGVHTIFRKHFSVPSIS